MTTSASLVAAVESATWTRMLADPPCVGAVTNSNSPVAASTTRTGLVASSVTIENV